MAVNEAANLFAPRPGRLFTIGQVIDKIKVDFPEPFEPRIATTDELLIPRDTLSRAMRPG